jgi:hypothetical protein
VFFNAHHEDVGFTLPATLSGSQWMAWMDTSQQGGLRPTSNYASGAVYPLQARSLVLLTEPHSNGIQEQSDETTS